MNKINGSFFIDQHGCAKNKVDGELIMNRLSKLGLTQTFDVSKADLIVVNSCGFIESAKAESLNAVYGARKEYPNAKILLAGCLAERYAEIFKTELPEVNGIFGNGDLSKIDEVIKDIYSGNRPVLVLPQKGVCCGERDTLLTFKGSAYVKITEGCNNRCTFCAIPIIRGNLRSRTANDIIEEIKTLISQGIYEINLIGQDSAAWGTGEDDNVFGNGKEPLAHINAQGEFEGAEKESALARLLKMISALPGAFRLRLLYIHPDHFNRDILPVIKNDSRLLAYFDVPFQSGDDSVIKTMNRIGTTQLYKSLIADIRKVLPDATIRTTFMTGFPGETDEFAQNTYDFLDAIKPDWSGCFEYSREEDTPAYSFKNRVVKKTATARANRLVQLQSSITKEKMLSRVNNEYDVLVEEVLGANEENDSCFAIGRAWFQSPEVDGSVVIRYEAENAEAVNAIKTGRIVKVRIVASGDVDLDGIFISDSPINKELAPSKLTFAPELTE